METFEHVGEWTDREIRRAVVWLCDQTGKPILRHQSQMESAPFKSDDERLFWQRAEDRNHATAERYARLGLASYEAIEAFVQYKF